MTKFIPGKIVKEITTKKGKHITFRYPRWEDLDEYTRFINKASKEDTFIIFSGEELSKSFEADFLAQAFKDAEFAKKITLGAWEEDVLIATTGIERTDIKRFQHVGEFGIIVDDAYRGEGIGYELAKTVIDEAKRNMENLKIITLYMFSNNEIAQHLYKKLGFIDAGRIPGAVWYKEEYIDRVSMYLPLYNTP